MTASIWNRICTFLAFAGLFVAGYLSVSAYMNWEIPCSGSHACDIVQHSSYSTIAGVNVAYLGLLAYLFLVICCLLRAFGNADTRNACTKAGLAISGLGTLFSMYLVYVSITEIHQTCIWCISSAVIMTLSFLSHGFLSQAEYQGTSNRKAEWIFAGVLTVLLGVGIGLRWMDVKKSTILTVDTQANALIDDMIPTNPQSMGPVDAKVIVIEFGDLMCPHCKDAYQQLHRALLQSNGQLRLIFRQYPLIKIHQYALLAAVVAEMAAEKGKFWDFLDLVYSAPDQEALTTKDIMSMASQVGLDPSTIAQRMSNPNDKAVVAVQEDIQAGNDLKIAATPTFLWGIKGQKVKGGGSAALRDAMAVAPFNKYVKGLN